MIILLWIRTYREIFKLHWCTCNKSHLLYTSQIYYNSQVEIGHTFTEISSNLMDVTHFFWTEILASLFRLSWRNYFPPTFLLKACAILTVKLWIFKFLARKHEAQCLWSARIPKSSQSQKATDGVSDRWHSPSWT